MKFHAGMLIISKLCVGETCEAYFRPFFNLFHLSSVEEADGAGGLTGLRLVVGYHYDGASVFLIQLMDEVH